MRVKIKDDMPVEGSAGLTKLEYASIHLLAGYIAGKWRGDIEQHAIDSAKTLLKKLEADDND